MNKIEKGKTALIVFGVILLIGCALSEIFGIILVCQLGLWNIIFGVALILIGILLLLLGIYFVWVGASQVATKGSLKEDNIAKSGTVNAKLCTKCGNELPLGADYCPKCGQTASSCKVYECGAENNIENKRCTSCGKEI